MLIYKIFRGSEWAALTDRGATFGAPIDLEDGYIHFSDAAQVAETAAKHFAGVTGLVLVAIEADALGAELRWEVSRGGATFPDPYRALNRAEVTWHADLPLGPDGRHHFPHGVT